MATIYHANQYNSPFERPHNQQWELDKNANVPFDRAGWVGVPYNPPVRVKRDCGPFERNDLKVKNACEVTDFVVKNDRGHLKDKYKDQCGIPFYGNYRTTWDMPGTILGPRERHTMGRRTPYFKPRCTAEAVPRGNRSCYGQWDNKAKALQDAKDIGAESPLPAKMQKKEIENWEECAGRKMPYRVGKHTDALTNSPVPRLKRWEKWDPNHKKCRKLADFCGKPQCEAGGILFIVDVPPPAPMYTVKRTKAETCMAACVEKCFKREAIRPTIGDAGGSCQETKTFRPVW